MSRPTADWVRRENEADNNRADAGGPRTPTKREPQ